MTTAISRMLWPGCLGMLFLAAKIGIGAEALESRFLNPPESAQPWTFWYWINGNVTKEGIRADLEDMKRVGIGGAMLFDGKMYLPPGPVRYGTDLWHEHVQYAIAQADKLGLKLGVMNCAGWATAGGPWITIEQSMKMFVWSEQPVEGGALWKGKLPRPPTRKDFYREVAVFAVPEPELPEPTIETANGVVTFTFQQTVECRLLKIATADGEGGRNYRGLIEASEDGIQFQSVARFDDNSRNWPMPLQIPFPPKRARVFRVKPAGPLGTAALRLSNASRLASVAALAGVRPITNEPSDGGQLEAVSAGRIIDLSDRLRADGSLEWQAPPGRWTILRFGYTTTAAENHPAVPEGTGWEVDKFDAEAVAFHFERGLGRIIREAGPRVGRSLVAAVSDSWEAGPQTWTAEMPRLFKERRGYAPGPYLTCLAGCVVGSREESEAFLRDFRSTLGDLYAEKFYATMRRMAHERGLQFMGEGYGGVLDEFKVGAQLDAPAVEFWNHDLYKACGVTPSVAHTLGKPIVTAEAFTSRQPNSRWTETPASLKALGDTAFTVGVNRFTLHAYVHQPRADILPGFTHGRYGTQFGRANSWWPLASGWIDYLRRCQSLLQSGAPVTDLLYLVPEHLQTEERDLNFPWPQGYAGDLLSVNQLAQAKVSGGRIQLAGGTNYRVLILPERWAASLETLQHLKRLHEAGAIIMGPRPTKPTGLFDATSGRAAWEAAMKGWPFREQPTGFSFAPDFKSAANLRFTHRAAEGADLYFVANPTPNPVNAEVEFRLTGREPELWDAATGEMVAAPAFEMTETSTRMNLALDAAGSIFVVFQKPTALRKRIAPPPPPASVLTVNGPWVVQFQEGRGAPAMIVLSNLVSFPKHSDPAVRYFSGLATYMTGFELPAGFRRCRLNLGDVYDLAEVKVNDQVAGIVWKPPFVIDVTKQLRPGTNRLAITVANRWINRLIGDEKLPADAEFLPDSINAGALKAFPEWWTNAVPKRQRVTFATWKHYQGNEPLVDSGLLGPVRLEFSSNTSAPSAK